MKQTLLRQLLVFLFLVGASSAVAQVDSAQSHPEHEEHNHTDTANEHDAETAHGEKAADHSQHGSGEPGAAISANHEQHESPPDTGEAEHQHMPEAMNHEAMSDSMMQSEEGDPQRDSPEHGEHNRTGGNEHNAETAHGDEVLDHSQHGSGEPEVAISTNHEQHGSQPDTGEAEHQHMPEAMDHEAMSHSMMQSEEVGPLRDPHAYSNGFELTSGPYLLESESKISLADETYFTGLWVDRFEYVDSHDLDATEFEGFAWIGDSYNRLLLRSEFEMVNDSIETAELDLLHTRAISPFWNVQYGLRREFGEIDERNWASIGLGGLAPYWFEVDASLFLGENGNSLLDIEAEYDLLLTQRLVLQPRVDIHSYGKTDKEMGAGSGLSTLKTGFRIRYEFDRQLAPYIGYERVITYGETADLLPAGEDRTSNHWIFGFKFWF